ncbi:MAG: SAM-dependent chlorinase/fluorinase [Bacillota bacterium]
MKEAGPVVLLTDFGWGVYAGVMKGVILSICPGVQVVDLTHDVAPQNVREGAWLLLTNFAWFPKGSIFVAVVDPGVGTERKALAVKAADYYFLGPDNGLLYPAAVRAGIAGVIELDPPADASRTFHGRDVFAPAAARLAAGAPFSELGRPGVIAVRLDFHLADREGEVVTIDRFGNVVTNLPPLPARRSYTVTLAGGRFRAEIPCFATYAGAPEDTLFLVTGSGGTLELSVRNGAAAPRLGVQVGDRITIA